MSNLTNNTAELNKILAAVNALPEAGGGSSGGANGIYMAKVTPASDAESITVTHNLGTTDILLAVCFVETLGNVTPTFNGAAAKFWAKSDIPRRVTSSLRGSNYDAHFYYGYADGITVGGTPVSDSYNCTVKDENNFIFARAGSAAAKYMAGVTYTVIIMAASAFSVTEV